MSASLSPHPDVAVLPSLPPSPSLLDEVFSHPRPWSVRLEEFNLKGPRQSLPKSAGSHAKGKGKQSIEEVDEDDEDSDAPHPVSTREAYPPMTDDAAETRRVEEVRARPPLPRTPAPRSPSFLSIFKRHMYSPPQRCRLRSTSTLTILFPLVSVI